MNLFTRLKPGALSGWIFSLIAVFSLAATAQAQEGKVIKSIDVQYVGSQTVSPDRIRSQMASQVGDKLSVNQLDEDVRKLYEGGDVENVRILSNNVSGGVALIVVVQTRAVYGGVDFVGNTLIDSAKLRKKVDLKVNKPIDEEALKTARQEIQEEYRKKGFSEATVTYRVNAPSAEGYSTVTYTINEGTQGILRNVDFVGNISFPAVRLKEEMTQKEKGVKTLFLGAEGSTDPETLAQDVRAIEDFYRDNGFLNAKVTNVSRVRADAKYVDVVITIDEGETYQVSSLSIAGVKALSVPDDILPYLKTKADDRFAGNKLTSDIKLIADQYGRHGYADVRVIPRLEDTGGGTVKVILDVDEGQIYTVRRVDIEGNNKTQDRVIRRELPLEPGQPYNTTRIDVTKRRLENMNYFENVDVIPVDTSYAGEKDLLIRVTEKPTGSLNFGAGFSSIDAVTGFIEVTQTNFDLFNWPKFMGAGQRFRFSLRGGSERTDASISITEPWFLGQRLALTVEGYYRNLLFLSDEYDQTEAGGAISLRKSLGEFTYGVIEYRGERIDVDAENDASPFFLGEDDNYFKSAITLSVTRDTRDNIFLPREGHKVSAGFEFAGLGGDVDDNTFTLTAAQHFTLPYDIIVNVNGSYKYSSDGDQIFQRHFLGGANNLRGFDFRDVGPRDTVGPNASNEVVGGNQAWNATVEVTFPIVEKIRGALFYDAGSVFDGPEGSTGGGQINSDWGIGARLFLLGSAPVRLDYAFPLQADGLNDEGGRFQFTLGAQF